MSDAIKLEVVNAAMAHLGEPPFESLEPAGPDARLQKVLGQLDGRLGAFLTALARHPWLCMLTYATLAPAARAGSWQWDKVFDLPDSFVKLWRLDALADEPFEVGTELVEGAIRKVLRANLASVNVAFTEAKAYEAITPDLAHYMGLELAARTAGPLQGDRQLAARLREEAKTALAEAAGGEAGQSRDPDPPFAGGFAGLRAQAG